MADTSSMQTVVTALTSQINAGTFFTTIADLVPYIAMLVPVVLGLYFLRKLVKGSGKGKLRF